MTNTNFELQKTRNSNGSYTISIEPLTNEGLEIMVNPSENLKNVSELLIWEEGIPYDPRSQQFDLTEFNLLSIEEEYLYLLHGL